MIFLIPIIVLVIAPLLDALAQTAPALASGIARFVEACVFILCTWPLVRKLDGE